MYVWILLYFHFYFIYLLLKHIGLSHGGISRLNRKISHRKEKKEKKYVHPQNKPQRTYPKYLEHKQSKVS